MKKIICLMLITAIALFGATSCEEAEKEHLAPALSDIDLSATSSIEGVTTTDTPTDYVLIEVEEYGKILVRLFPNVAPKTVENFKNYVSEKSYDGTIFHRVIEDFMIQGGGIYPDGSDNEKADAIKGEFTTNGFRNNLIHLRGVVSMARTNDPNSATSQFFIMHKTSPHLDGAYASFGYVVYGMDVVDDIAGVRTDANDQPKTDVVISSVRFADVSNISFDITK